MTIIKKKYTFPLNSCCNSSRCSTWKCDNCLYYYPDVQFQIYIEYEKEMAEESKALGINIEDEMANMAAEELKLQYDAYINNKRH